MSCQTCHSLICKCPHPVIIKDTQRIRELESEVAALPKTIADTFRECYASSYLRGDEVAQIIERRFGVSEQRSKAE